MKQWAGPSTRYRPRSSRAGVGSNVRLVNGRALGPLLDWSRFDPLTEWRSLGLRPLGKIITIANVAASASVAIHAILHQCAITPPAWFKPTADRINRSLSLDIVKDGISKTERNSV